MLKVMLVLLALAIGQSAAEVFTAMADMETLLGAEKQVTGVIDEYISAEMKRLERLQEFAKEYQKRNQEVIRDGSSFIGNPVNAYLLIKRLTSDWGFVESLMRNNVAEDFLANITNRRHMSAVPFPDTEDLSGAAVALLRLQDTYRLDTTEIASGKIQGVKRAETLNAHDCFELGRTAYNQGDYYHTLLWMQEAESRIEQEDPPTASQSEVLEYLAYSMYQQGNVKRALSLTKKLVKVDPEHPRAAGNVKWYEDELAQLGIKKFDAHDLPPVTNPRKDDGSIPERDDYEALCRGEIPMSEKVKAKLHCYLKMDRPYLKLAPIKVEIVHLNPMAVLFKGVISDYEISIIQELAKPRLRRATVHNRATGELVHASYRISKSAWLKGEEHPVIERVNDRLDMMTNLNMDTAEELQIACYGLGGHYDPHFDHARVACYGLGGHYDPHFDMSTRGEKDPYRDGTGNRIATVLFYMSQPEAGGATVFIPDKATVYPSHHDALFWYNLHKNGEGNVRTRHAACPVLAGTKWVANKWIHERGQEFRRPCGLQIHSNENYVGEL